VPGSALCQTTQCQLLRPSRNLQRRPTSTAMQPKTFLALTVAYATCCYAQSTPSDAVKSLDSITQIIKELQVLVNSAPTDNLTDVERVRQTPWHSPFLSHRLTIAQIRPRSTNTACSFEQSPISSNFSLPRYCTPQRSKSKSNCVLLTTRCVPLGPLPLFLSSLVQFCPQSSEG
jgi:hypothetical protein